MITFDLEAFGTRLEGYQVERIA